MYSLQALADGLVYSTAKLNGCELRDALEFDARASYQSQPLQTKHLRSLQVVQVRDQARQTNFTNDAHLDSMENSLGQLEGWGTSSR